MKPSGVLKCLLLAVFSVTATAVQIDTPPTHIDARRRSLQETEAGGGVVSVTTAQGLLDAVTQGTPHIEITAHLALAGLPIITPEDPTLTLATSLLGVLPATVKSIRGNCADAPPTAESLGITPNGQAAIRTFSPGQCLLSVDHEVLVVSDSDVWLDSLYVRLVLPRNTTFFEFVYVRGGGDIRVGPNAAVYMTNVTMQGNGDGSPDCVDCGVSISFNAGVYAEDCVFADFDGARATGVFSGATANFVKCKWENNNVVDPEQGDAAVIFADGLDEDDYAGYIDDGDALVRLEGCTFSGNEPSSAPVFLADDTGTDTGEAWFYSNTNETMRLKEIDLDNPEYIYRVDYARPLSEAPVYFLQSSDAWFINRTRELGGPLPPGVDSATAVTRANVVEEDAGDASESSESAVGTAISSEVPASSNSARLRSGPLFTWGGLLLTGLGCFAMLILL